MREAMVKLGEGAERLIIEEAVRLSPRFVCDEGAHGVTVELPESYGERIAEMTANERYRRKTEEEIAAIFTGTLRDYEINVRWSDSGPIFDVPGNACGVFVEGSDRSMEEYSDHNVDTAQQTLVLYTCLSIHMRNTLNYLGILLKDPASRPAQKSGEFFDTDIMFDKLGQPSIIRDNKLVEFPKKRG